jgi:tellurite resistance protein
VFFFLFDYESDLQDKRQTSEAFIEKYQNSVGEVFENDSVPFEKHVMSEVRELMKMIKILRRSWIS